MTYHQDSWEVKDFNPGKLYWRKKNSKGWTGLHNLQFQQLNGIEDSELDLSTIDRTGQALY